MLIGRDLVGGHFSYDPFDLYRRGVLTNPNMVVFGQIGRGKSAFVKTYLWRSSVFGRRAWVLDPKGEYGPLAKAWGCEPISLRPGGSVRLNPLDLPSAGPATDSAGNPTSPESAAEQVRRRGELLASLAEAGMGRGLLPSERAAVDLAVASLSVMGDSGLWAAPTLPRVVDALLDPTVESARTIRCDRPTLIADGRQVGLELRRLVAGDLKGMFDGPTTPGIDLSRSLVVLDLSAVFHSSALGILMTCAVAWLQAAVSWRPARALARPAGLWAPSAGWDDASTSGTLVVVDEAWAILSNLAVARWLQSSWKLSRAWGVSNIAVLHRVSDLHSSGSDGSQQVALAEGLLADSETRVVYGQAAGELEAAAAVLGLNETEADLVARLGRGVAIWKVGSRSFAVRHLLGPYEHRIVDTDGAMGAGVGATDAVAGPTGR